MTAFLPSTIRGELEGLRVAIVAACTGVITRTPTVRNRDYTNFFDGPWPLITIRYGRYRVDLLGGGLPLRVGQTLKNPNVYSIEIEDVVPPNSAPESEVVAASQDDLIDLMDAIMAYFDHAPYRCLPTTDGNMAALAGVPIKFDGVPLFTSEQGGDVRIRVVGAIGVQGIARTGHST